MLDALQVLMLDNRLFYHHDTFSHTEVMLYSGLRACGVNVIVYPWNERYHAPAVMPTDAWNLQFWNMRGGMNGITQQPYSYEQVCRMRFDLLIATTRLTDTPAGYDFLRGARDHFRVPFALLRTEDGGNAAWGIEDADIRFCADVPVDSTEDVYPLGQCIMYPLAMLAAREKIYGVHCWMSEYNNRRIHLIQFLRQLEGTHFVGEPRRDGGIGIIPYLEALTQSQIKYGIRGNGYNSQHLWEGLGAEGVMLIGDFEHRMPPPLPQPDIHYVKLDDENIIEQARFWLANEEARHCIAVWSRQWVYDHHTPKHRGLYFLERCKERIPNFRWQT